jgi:tetratricopeptide (TPR) repeat protein
MNKRNTLLILAFALILMLFAGGAMAQDEPTATPQPTPVATQEPPPDCPAFQGQSNSIRTSYYMGEGHAYLTSGQVSSAIFSFTCVIRVIDSNYVPAYMYRASAYSRLRDFDRAIRDYSTAIRLDSSLAPAHLNRGVIYAMSREFDEAAADFDRAMQIDRDYMPAYNNRAVLHAIEGEVDEAITVLETAIERSGIRNVLAAYQNPNRDPNADPIAFDEAAAQSYALLGIMHSRKSLDDFNRYLLLVRTNRYGRDERISSAAGALESRFTFEMRLDDGTWMSVADYNQVEE